MQMPTHIVQLQLNVSFFLHVAAVPPSLLLHLEELGFSA